MNQVSLAVNPPTALQRVGLSREQVQAMAWRQQVQVRAVEPAPKPRAYRSPRLVNTQYLDGEQQRAKKAVMHANEAVIVGMVMQGVPVVEIALAFGVTDQAIRNRIHGFGIRPRAPVPAVGIGLRRWLSGGASAAASIPS